jgi:SAM-dependent methyltransferase
LSNVRLPYLQFKTRSFSFFRSFDTLALPFSRRGEIEIKQISILTLATLNLQEVARTTTNLFCGPIDRKSSKLVDNINLSTDSCTLHFFLNMKFSLLAVALMGASMLHFREIGASDVSENIESMAIYLSDRLPRELNALRERKQNEQIEIEDLLAFDQMHYEGETAMISAMQYLQISNSSRILDVGSGYGGPARYVAWKTGALVTALELQPEISAEAKKLTELVGHTRAGKQMGHISPLLAKVDHQVGNVMKWGPETFPVDTKSNQENKYNGFMSMLVFLHVQDKQELFSAIAQTLKPGARFYIEDYFNRNELNTDDMKVLNDIVMCGPLPTEKEYIRLGLELGLGFTLGLGSSGRISARLRVRVRVRAT